MRQIKWEIPSAWYHLCYHLYQQRHRHQNDLHRQAKFIIAFRDHDHHLDSQVKGIECYCGGGGCSSSQVSVHSCCQSAVSWGLFPARLPTYNFPTVFQKMFTIPYAQYSPIYDVHSTEYSFGCNRRWLGLASMSALFLVQPSLPAQWNDIQHSILQMWWKQSFLLQYLRLQCTNEKSSNTQCTVTLVSKYIATFCAGRLQYG